MNVLIIDGWLGGLDRWTGLIFTASQDKHKFTSSLKEKHRVIT